MRNLELEQVIYANPDSKEAWLVYADWLSAQGDVRGEIIALSYSARPPKKEIAQRTKANQDAWLLPVVGKKKSTPLGKASGVRLVWEKGFVREASIFQTGEPQYNDETFYYGSPRGPGVAEKLGALLGSEGAAFISKIHVQFTEEDINSSALATVGCPLLTELVIGSPDQEILSATTLGKIAALAKSLPRLRRLSVLGQGSGFDLGNSRTSWASLQFLSVTGLYFGESLWGSLAKVKLPELEELSIEVIYSDILVDSEVIAAAVQRGARKEGEVVHPDVDSVLQRKDLKKLRKLTLHGEAGPDIIGSVLASPLLPQLTHVSLQKNNLGEEGAKLILDNIDRFKHLELLDVDFNRIRSELAGALRAYPWIQAGACHEDAYTDWG